jgi:hypothetical protein
MAASNRFQSAQLPQPPRNDQDPTSAQWQDWFLRLVSGVNGVVNALDSISTGVSLSDQIFSSISASNVVTSVVNGPTTGVLSSQTGSINTYTVTQHTYTQIGKLTFFDLVFDIIDKGTAGGHLVYTLPVPASNLPYQPNMGSGSYTTTYDLAVVASTTTTLSFAHAPTGATIFTSDGTGHLSGWYYAA